MDLIKRVESRLDPEKKLALEQWYAWAEAKAEETATIVRKKIAFEVGHVPDEVFHAIRGEVLGAIKAAGRHIVTTKLVEPIRADNEDEGGK